MTFSLYSKWERFIWAHGIACSYNTDPILMSMQKLALLWVIKIVLSGHIWEAATKAAF